MRSLFSAAVLLATILRGAEIQPVSNASAAEHWQTTSERGVRYLPASSRTEQLINTVGARADVETKVGQWDSGSVHATFIALEIYQGEFDRTERGLRIELSRPGTNAVIYVDEAVFAALHQVMANYTAHLPTAEDCGPGNPSGGRLSWLFDPPHRVVHLLNTGVYFDAGARTPGVFLGRGFKTANSSGDFRFPGKLPADFDKMLDAAVASFRRAAGG
jgi:hypothetical protein